MSVKNENPSLFQLAFSESNENPMVFSMSKKTTLEFQNYFFEVRLWKHICFMTNVEFPEPPWATCSMDHRAFSLTIEPAQWTIEHVLWTIVHVLWSTEHVARGGSGNSTFVIKHMCFFNPASKKYFWILRVVFFDIVKTIGFSLFSETTSWKKLGFSFWTDIHFSMQNTHFREHLSFDHMSKMVRNIFLEMAVFCCGLYCPRSSSLS